MVTKKPFGHIFLKWVISLTCPQQEPSGSKAQVIPAFPNLPSA